jgi:hypothetical protein
MFTELEPRTRKCIGISYHAYISQRGIRLSLGQDHRMLERHFRGRLYENGLNSERLMCHRMILSATASAPL